MIVEIGIQSNALKLHKKQFNLQKTKIIYRVVGNFLWELKSRILDFSGSREKKWRVLISDLITRGNSI